MVQVKIHGRYRFKTIVNVSRYYVHEHGSSETCTPSTYFRSLQLIERTGSSVSINPRL